MDTRLTFRDYERSIKTDAGTQRVSSRCNGLTLE
jgi:hypothetical protein